MPDHPFQIDRYRILHEIGSGGMATVYAAIQPRPRRTVALKVLKSDAASDTAVRRFKREAEILARLRHPAIAQVYDAGTYEDKGKVRPFFVMEYIPGAKTILEFVAQKQLNRRDRLKLFVNVCRAVEYGHRHRVLHRDLKPGNILIDQSGQLKIIDFGVASAPDLKVKGTTMHTEAGVLVGTIQYMSPEQVASHPHDLDPRSDVYSLGVLLYKLMTGQFPHELEGLPIYEAVRLIREEDPIRPSAREAELKGDLETIILRAIARDAAQRYQSAGALAADIVQHLNKQPIAAKPPADKKEKSSGGGRRVALAAIVIVLLLAIGGGAWWWLNRDSTTVPITSSFTPAPTQDTTNDQNESTKTTPFVLDAQNGRITALAMDADGERIASAAHDDSIVIWSTAAHAPLITFYEHRAPPIAVNFIGDGSKCISIDENGVLLEWNTRDGSVLHEVQSPSQKTRTLAINSDGDRVALACEDGTVRISSIAKPNWTTLRGNTGAFHSAAFSHDGSMIVAGSAQGDVYIWNSTTGERLHRLNGLNAAVVFVMVMDGASHVIAIDANGNGMTWQLTNGNDVGSEFTMQGRRFDACEGITVATALSPSKKWLVAASADSLRVWNVSSLSSGAMIKQHGDTARTTQRIYSVAIDDDAKRIAIGSDGGEVHVRHIDN